MNNTINKPTIEALAAELSKLGWDASASGTWLQVAEAPMLRTPMIRGCRYVWDGYHAQKPATMARRLDNFLRDIGKMPANQGDQG